MAEEIIRQDEPFGRELEPGEEFIVVDPARMAFVFNLGDEECHEKWTGTCSLEKRRPLFGYREGGEASLGYCPRLLKSLRRDGLYSFMHIDIIKCACGHYEFNGGQHRICIAKKMGLKIEALVTTIDEDCEVCQGKAWPGAELR